MKRRNFLSTLALTGMWNSIQKYAKAADPASWLPDVEKLTGITLGGAQLWTDQLLFHGWRIQKHSSGGQFRLLDDGNVRLAEGTFDLCRLKLDQVKKERKLPEMSDKVVIALHGLFRTRSCMSGLADYFAEKGKYTALTFGYASTRGEVGRHAEGLASVLKHLDGVKEVHLIGHSLGNIVARHYFADATNPQTGEQGDPRIKRFVMLGPPNNGSQLAESLGQNSLFESIVGSTGQQLGRAWAELEKKLATPACEFGIVAGGRGDGQGYNPMLEGDDDLVVTVESAKLPGARDFLLVPVAHSFLMFSPQVREAALNFFQQGYFVSEAKRQPLAKKG